MSKGNYRNVSDCCGSSPVGASDDMGICPRCREHCEYIDPLEEELKDQLTALQGDSVLHDSIRAGAINNLAATVRMIVDQGERMKEVIGDEAWELCVEYDEGG